MVLWQHTVVGEVALEVLAVLVVQWMAVLSPVVPHQMVTLVATTDPVASAWRVPLAVLQLMASPVWLQPKDPSALLMLNMLMVQIAVTTMMRIVVRKCAQ
jgi:hypothetical protein